jgi:hypothetical protein
MASPQSLRAIGGVHRTSIPVADSQSAITGRSVPSTGTPPSAYS